MKFLIPFNKTRVRMVRYLAELVMFSGMIMFAHFVIARGPELERWYVVVLPLAFVISTVNAEILFRRVRELEDYSQTLASALGTRPK